MEEFALNVFDVVGPVMIGPSSSHTAGAVKLGYAGCRILGRIPAKVYFELHGSFAATGRGHGTDLALVAGILGMHPDDERIKDSFQIAQQKGLEYSFSSVDLGDVHPNTVRMTLSADSFHSTVITGSSIGGGRIVLMQIDGFLVNITGEYAFLLAAYLDQPGVIAEVTTVLSRYKVNIGFMHVSRTARGKQALMVLETDTSLSDEMIADIKDIACINIVRSIDKL
jgi:L-serine dehydratase